MIYCVNPNARTTVIGNLVDMKGNTMVILVVLAESDNKIICPDAAQLRWP